MANKKEPTQPRGILLHMTAEQCEAFQLHTQGLSFSEWAIPILMEKMAQESDVAQGTTTPVTGAKNE